MNSSQIGSELPGAAIRVSGDILVNWILARQLVIEGSSPGWKEHTNLSCLLGGAVHQAKFIEAVAAPLLSQVYSSIQINYPRLDTQSILPGDPRFHHAYHLWEQYRHKESAAWRIKEFLGGTLRQEAIQLSKEEDLANPPRIIILVDSNLGFRDDPRSWLPVLECVSPETWIVLKTTWPVAQGALWDYLLQKHADRLILILTVDDLRSAEAQISRELSWERTVQDLVWEVTYNPKFNMLSRCAQVVISFNMAGAVLLSRWESDHPPSQHSNHAVLIYDPKEIEGSWEASYPGQVLEHLSCLVAGVVRECLQNPLKPAFSTAVQAGLTAMRMLHRLGFQESPSTSGSGFQLVFPCQQLQKGFERASPDFFEVRVPRPVYDRRELVPGEEPASSLWKIAENLSPSQLSALAINIVLEGTDSALKGFPLARFGRLLTLDRREIESFRTLKSLITEYTSQAWQKKPLSIAVFGSPGSGKSFGIKEIARNLFPGQLETLEFNLSQFETLEDLHTAFHQVRDTVLRGKIPLVFWDEFDTQMEGRPLGWLCHFLAPMQDGQFQHGQINHPIGQSIFVFAGGTSVRMEEFGKGLDPQLFSSVKGPDFISRLKGYVNILGPNRLKPGTDGAGVSDPYFIVRRAILLRSMLSISAPHLFDSGDGKGCLNIDRGVLRAFLEAPEYRHGARSIEAIIAMSRLSGKRSFERSCLPPEQQLDLHVRGKSFLALVQQIDLQGELLEKLAAAAHTVYCAGLEKRGFKHGALKSEELKTSPLLVPFSELSPEMQQQNRDYVRDIADKLARLGYMMLPARSGEAVHEFNRDEIEILARWEHDRYVDAKLSSGWVYSAADDPALKHNRSLIRWSDLDEDNRSKDRDFARSIPELLAYAGYSIVSLQNGSPSTSEAHDAALGAATGADSSPKPVRVGVTGHRKLNNQGAIVEGIESALRMIEATYPGKNLHLYSALAEGADRLAAQALLPRPAAQLVVPLPLAVDDYSQDFRSKKSKEEFRTLLARASEVIHLPDAPTRTQAYLSAGLFILSQCDVLLAVWDGSPPQGEGGTGEIVAEARRIGLPVAWVYAPRSTTTHPGIAPGNVNLERWPCPVSS